MTLEHQFCSTMQNLVIWHSCICSTGSSALRIGFLCRMESQCQLDEWQLHQCYLEGQLGWWKGSATGFVVALLLAAVVQYLGKRIELGKGQVEKVELGKNQVMKVELGESEVEMVEELGKNQLDVGSLPGCQERIAMASRAVNKLGLEKMKADEVAKLRLKTVVQLKAMLKEANLPMSGIKEDIVDRLAEYELNRHLVAMMLHGTEG